MVRNLISRFKRWIVNKVTNWEEYWGQALPNYSKVFKTQNGKIMKDDGVYYQKIADMAANAPFMNELSELQEKLRGKAFDANSRLDYTQGSALWQTYKGTELVVKMILSAKRKLTQENVANG